MSEELPARLWVSGIEINPNGMPDRKWGSSEWGCLRVLYANKPNVVDYQVFARPVWGEASCTRGQVNAAVGRISERLKSLQDGQGRPIRHDVHVTNVRNKGYRLEGADLTDEPGPAG